MMKTVLLSGASGFIARRLARKLKDSGFKTIGISHSSFQIPGYDLVIKSSLMYPLSGVFEKENIDVFIHCAYFRGKDEYRINVEGTKLWAEQAKKNGVDLQIFLSSISAKQDSLSSYGKAKYDLEQWFIKSKNVSFRLGLVVGNGGMFEKMVSPVKKYPFLPLLDNGSRLVYLTPVDSVCDVIKDIAVDPSVSFRGKVFNLFQPQPVTLRLILNRIKKHYNLFCLFIPVSSILILPFIKLMEFIPFIRLDISSNNIIGMRQNEGRKHRSDLSKFGYPELSFDEMLEKIRIR
ncbi:MAG: NAD-dependent epimerase/dehydratase family protein [Candidatus Aminicenantaceae bacterium]